MGCLQVTHQLSRQDSELTVLFTFDFEEWMGLGRVYEADLYTKTKRVVEFLVERGLPATFFLDAETTVRYPDAVQLLLDGGFELALHTDRHFGPDNQSLIDLDFGRQKSDQQMARIENGIHVIRQVVPSFQPVGFRSPGLRWNEDLYISLQALGFKYDSSRMDKFSFQPFVEKGVVVIPVNCGDFDSACYKLNAQHVVRIWRSNFVRASNAVGDNGCTHYTLLAHPSVCGKYKYIGMLKAIFLFMEKLQPKYLTCSEIAGKYAETYPLNQDGVRELQSVHRHA